MSNPKEAKGRAKPSVHLVPPALIIHTALAMADGATKYGAYNWRETEVSINVYTSALLRHILSYTDGEDKAADSGCLHLAHAAACIGILLDAAENGNLVDDRPSNGPASALLERISNS